MFLVYLGVCWLLGLWLSTALPIDIRAWLSAGLVSLAGAALLRKREPQSAAVLALLFALCAGAARQLAAQPCYGRPADAAGAPCDLGDDVRQYIGRPTAVTLTGVVIAEPDVAERSIQLRVAVESVQTAPAAAPVAASGTVLIFAGRFPELPYGARIAATGKLETPFESPTFSYKELLAREGIYGVMNRPQIAVVATEQGRPWRAALIAFKQAAVAAIDRSVPAPEAGLLQAMLLGEERNLAPPLRDAFRATGMSHVIAISGFHVAILTLVVVSTAEALLGRRASVAATIVVLALYTVLVGARPSVVRAALMAIIYLIGQRLLGRSGFAIGSLFAVAILMTAWNPQTLWSIGFQLSFAATLGIMLYAGRWETAVRRTLRNRGLGWLTHGAPGALWMALIVSAAAQLFTLPLTIATFGQLSPIALFVNVAVVPLLPFALVLGGLTVLGGLLAAPLGRLLGLAAWLFLRYTTAVVEAAAQLPWASVPIELANPTLFAVGAYLALGALTGYGALTAEQRRTVQTRLRHNLTQRAAAAGLSLAAVLAVGWHASQPDGRLHIAFFDVGQGDAALIVTPTGRQILVDGGYFPAVLGRHLGRTLPFWDREIDLMIATHPDADHISGLPGVFDRYRVGRLLVADLERGLSPIYDALFEQAELHQTPVERVQAGQVIAIGDGVRLEILHPGDQLSAEGRNDNSVVVRIVYGDFTCLLTGDAETAAEQAMLQGGRPLQALVFKAGHHGSRGSSSAVFLDAVQPQIAVISAGRDNTFGHPHAELLERLAARQIAVLRTDQLGSLRVTTDGAVMWWQARR